MSSQPVQSPEAWLAQTAGELLYPQTPDIAGAVLARTHAQGATAPPRRLRLQRTPALAWTIALLVVALASLFVVPGVRARIADFIQVGLVRIFLGGPTPTAPAPATATPNAPQTPAPLTETPTPGRTATPLAWLSDLDGETTLEQAGQALPFTLRLPTYPAGLGAPDLVFVQDMGSPMAILVWMDAAAPTRVRMSLHILAPGGFSVEKSEPVVVEGTSVDNHFAVWTTGPYLVRLHGGNLDVRRMIDGHVLIWEAEDGLTYRLETDLPLEEAVRVAESLR